MSQDVRERKQELMKKYKQVTEYHSDPRVLSLALERDEAKISIVSGPWIWDVVVKYFPLATRDNWKKNYEIVKKAVKICQELGVQIGIMFISGKLTKNEKTWVKNGFWWKIKRFPRVGRITKKDAKRLQQHRYQIIGGIAKGGMRVLTAAGYKEGEAKHIFLTGTVAQLGNMNLLPDTKTNIKIEYKKKK